MKTCLIVLWLAGALSVGSADAAEPGISGTEIRLGMVNAQTGAASGLGRGMLAGAAAVFHDVNAHGGIQGRRVELIVADDAYDPEKSITETLALIEEKKVFSLFGSVGTPTTNAIIPILQETRTPLIGAFTGSMTLRQPVVHEIINFRASYDDETDALVSYFTSKGAKRFGVLYQDDGFGYAVLDGTVRALKRRGLELVAKGSFVRGTTAVKGGLAALVGQELEVVVMVGPYTPLATFVQEAGKAGLKTSMATVSFVGTDNFLQLVGSSGNGVLISQVVPFPSDRTLPVAAECAALLAQYAPGTQLSFVNFEGCITAKAMVAGLHNAGQELTRERLIRSFETFDRLDIGGLHFTLGQGNHQATNAVFLTRIEDGKIVPVTRPADRK
jgi:ABC-type branched-subunit amino acid transport system substrate-binding protein